MPTSAKTRRPVRVANDPDRYVRQVKGGRYQARPFDEGVRYNLGCFETRAQARKAILEFWWGRLAPRLRWTKPVPLPDGGTEWLAVVRVPGEREKRKRGGPAPEPGLVTVRVGRYATAKDAHLAAKVFLRAALGPLPYVAVEMGLQRLWLDTRKAG